jgi:hypothetical protein
MVDVGRHRPGGGVTGMGYTSDQYDIEVATLGLIDATKNAFASLFERVEALENVKPSAPGKSGDHKPK